MTINSEDLLNSILASLDRVDYINADDIPNIDMYMDQVTTFMDKRLKSSVRYPNEDKILTKTMINNYAKNNLLPPPEKKKYKLILNSDEKRFGGNSEPLENTVFTAEAKPWDGQPYSIAYPLSEYGAAVFLF